MDLDQYLEKMITNTIVIWIRWAELAGRIIINSYQEAYILKWNPI